MIDDNVFDETTRFRGLPKIQLCFFSCLIQTVSAVDAIGLTESCFESPSFKPRTQSGEEQDRHAGGSAAGQGACTQGVLGTDEPQYFYSIPKWTDQNRKADPRHL
jgi:hypothetical protein